MRCVVLAKELNFQRHLASKMPKIFLKKYGAEKRTG